MNAKSVIRVRNAAMAMLLSLTVLIPIHGASAGQVYKHGDPNRSRIAITVDDCFDLGILQDMLDLFSRENVRVTFYPVGRFIKEKDRELWLRVINDGHEIGNHTYNHKKLTNLTGNRIREELKMAQKALNKALGFDYSMRTMRPPYGSFNANKTLQKIYRSGWPNVIFWSVSQGNADKAIEKIRGGSVCLFHTIKRDYNSLTRLIPQLKEMGFEMVTVSELFGFDNVLPEGGGPL